MDLGECEDVAGVGRTEDFRVQGKESDMSLERRDVLEPPESVTHREGDCPRSSIQQLVDILNGNDPNSVVNMETSQNPCTSYGEKAEERVQELTLSHYCATINTVREDDFMDSMLSDLQLRVGLEAGSSHEHPPDRENNMSTSRAAGKMRCTEVFGEQPSDLNANVKPGLSPDSSSGSGLQNTLPPGGMRTKILSKSSGYSEFFVKNTLKGKGVFFKGPTAAVLRDQVAIKVATASMPTSDPAADEVSKSVAPCTRGNAAVDVGTSGASGSDGYGTEGMSLREWIKSGRSKLHKVDSLCIFKEMLDMVHSVHSESKVLADLRPSSFRLLPGRKVKYFGRLSLQTETHTSVMHKKVLKSHGLKRPLEQGTSPYFDLAVKNRKLTDNAKISKMESQSHLGYGLKTVTNDIDANVAGPGPSAYQMGHHSNVDSKARSNSNRLQLPTSAQQHSFSVVDQLEEKWYRSPEELLGRGSSCSSNVYCLGVFLFELLSHFDSGKVHAAAMSDLRHRILPPNFLSENPKEAGFCLWLLHPEPSLRPTARDILQSEVVSGFQALCGDDKAASIEEDEGESELLLHFLASVKVEKQKHAVKLVEDIGCIEADIKELDKRHFSMQSANLNGSSNNTQFARGGDEASASTSEIRDSRFLKNVDQLESAYFSARSQIQVSVNDLVVRSDRDILQNRDNWYSDKKDEENQEGCDSQGGFFDGLCKYARYSKLEACGTLRNRDITNSTNVICSLSFDRDEDYFAAAGVSKKIKIFDFQALYDNTVDIHYPVIEMSNKSKLSCVSWNNYIRNYLASTDYDGIVKLWDASTGQPFTQYTEHEKRAWSVDFSELDPTKLASGSDDCSVKLWNINEKSSLHSIRNIANVCCVQFSAHSSNMLAFGSADYKIYCYDLRNPNVPWCILAGHEKAVSYVKFVDSGTLVSASTDNTLKLWDLNRSSSAGLSTNACTLTLSGHTNEKNFVGLSVADGYIACGSESNEVYTYYKSLPMPITSHKFGMVDPISGKETDDDNGQFVSSVCWKGKSNVVVAANSTGCIKVLRMV